VIDVHGGAGRERLEASLGVPRWVDAVARSGPFPTIDALVAAADAAGADLTGGELTAAVAHQARLGASGGPAGQPDGLGRTDEGVDAAIARGSEVYEQRFGRPALLRTAGRTRQEVLDELQRRLKHDPDEEAAEAKEQLRAVAAQRLRSAFEAAG
jgi:2-oxo-4-hydroxy-4-carboxy-5-ureidoimidazoline decarboxylase